MAVVQEQQNAFPLLHEAQLQQDLHAADDTDSGSVDSDGGGGGEGGGGGTTYTRLPTQVNLPKELALKLDRQGSSDSMEEGIQVDAAPEGSEEETESQESQYDDDEGPEPRGERSVSVVSASSEEGGGRDSGIEAEREPDMVLPDENLMAKVVAQVEFYFSDANVAKDKFLLKHIRRNKEGYVSLKLVSSFKKVKQLTRDWRVVAHSLTKSSGKIQINDLGTKIRRVEPLPELSETPVTCAVLALGLTDPKPTIQSVSDLFSTCGDIAFIRVLKAGSTIPQDLKSLTARHSAFATSDCAWIEFENHEAARVATELSQEGGLQVVPILPEAQKKPEKTASQQKQQQPPSRKNSVNGHPQQQKGPASRKNSTAGSHKGRKDSNCGQDGDTYQHPHYNQLGPRQPRRKCLSLPQTQSPNLSDLSAVVEARRNRPKSKSCAEFQLGTPPPASWVQRHLLAAAAASAASAASPVIGSRPPGNRPNRISHGSLPLPDGVARFPKGPDGSKGFGGTRRRVTSQDSISSDSAISVSSSSGSSSGADTS